MELCGSERRGRLRVHPHARNSPLFVEPWPVLVSRELMTSWNMQFIKRKLRKIWDFIGKPPAFFKYGMRNKFKIKCLPPNSVYQTFQLISVELYHASYENMIHDIYIFWLINSTDCDISYNNFGKSVSSSFHSFS